MERTDGERWAAELLDRLRAERFTARAWVRFLEESFRRARRDRGRRPEAVRQSRRWGVVGLAAAVPFGPGPALWWAGWWAMLDWHIGMLETHDGRPRQLCSADALTLARLWAAPVVRRHPAPAVVLALSASDVLDGTIARRAGPTRLGRDFDSAADTAFFVAVLRGAVDRGLLDPRLLAVERARLVAGGAVAVLSYFGGSKPPAGPGNRELAAVLAGAGGFLAVAGHKRPARPLIAAAIGARLLERMRAAGFR